jgi:phage terminase large subunit-like protein
MQLPKLDPNNPDHAQAIILAEKARNLAEENRLAHYIPYEFQAKFHAAMTAAGSHAKQKVLMAANQVGKTFVGAMETAIHATGRYPEWWTGWRCDHAPSIWVGADTNTNCRDIVQTELLGDPEDEETRGKGAIPKECIGKTMRKAGIPGALETVMIKHVTGKWSRIMFKSYESGKEQWMGVGVDFVWLDEEPPMDIFSQALRGTVKKDGRIYMTFTPEKGMSEVVRSFHDDVKPGQVMWGATWADAPHMTPEKTDQILAALPPHERKMRSQGIPVLGSGLVFPVNPDDITCEPFQIPRYYKRIAGIDFGYDHPTAVVWIAWDTENDVIYVTHTHCQSGQVPAIHAEAIRTAGEWIPVAWPHDGMVRDKGSGEGLAAQYHNLKVNMLPRHFENIGVGGNSVEPGIMDMLERMQSGRFKVFSTLGEWFKEHGSYHRKDGVIIKERDDLMAATRYAVMSRNYAAIKPDENFVAQTQVGISDYDPFESFSDGL